MQKKENYIDINGNFPEAGKCFYPDDIVFEKSDLIDGKFLIKEELKEDAKHTLSNMREDERRFYVL